MKRQMSIVFSSLSLLAVFLAPNVTTANAPAGRYVTPNGQVAYDTKTGLTWMRGYQANQTWGSVSTTGTAQATCAALKLNNATGWRVPTINELLTLVDRSQAYTGTTALIDSNVFSGTPAQYFWASTPVAGSTSTALAWYVDFSTGRSGPFATSNTVYVRCVHE